MTKRKFADKGSCRLNVVLPSYVAKELNQLLLNPITQRPVYGARSQLVSKLVLNWVKEEKLRRLQRQQERENSNPPQG